MERIVDRDPHEMIRFATSADAYVSEIVPKIRAIQGMMEFFKSQLDDSCQLCIENLNTDCEEYLKKVNIYHELADQIRKKAQKQIDARMR